MRFEATEAILYRWPQGEIQLQPGQSIDLPEDRALRLLTKAPGKVRAVLPKFSEGASVCFEHWTDMLIGTVDGPPWFEDRVGIATGYWYVIRLPDDSYSLAHESRLSDAGLVKKTLS